MSIVSVNAENYPTTDEIIVKSSSNEKVRNFTGSKTLVLDKEFISSSGSANISQLLNSLSFLNISEKGSPGSQYDISMRGSTFENVLFMVNGIPVHDYQTGHFLMDIPVDISDVEKIEIITGSGSSFYGSSSSGGAINIITDKNRKGTDINLNLGSFNTRKMKFSQSTGIKDILLKASANTVSSDGYEKGYDIRETGFNLSGKYEKENVSVKIESGIISKKFGAQNFYSLHPSFESTETFFAGINTSYAIDENNLLKINFGSRGHSDDFILIRNNPDYYHNTHFNRSFIEDVALTTKHDNGFITNIGTESEFYGITSGQLGSHSDYRHSIFGMVSSELKKIDYSLSMRMESGSRDNIHFLPGFGVVIFPGEKISWRIRAEKTYRPPTYTELFYNSPVNSADNNLHSEKSLCLESGLDFKSVTGLFSLTTYSRETVQVIDWVKKTDESIWKSVNHGSVKNYGLEADFNRKITQKVNWGLNCSFLEQRVHNRKGEESKYALNPVNKSGCCYFSFKLKEKFGFNVNTRYEHAKITGSNTTVNINCSRKTRLGNFIISCRNLFDYKYEEIPGIKASGRWLSIGVEYK